MSWVLAIAGFALLVVLHEAGHFTAAKAVGMRVERFFLFFPPKVFSVKRGETEYGIGAIPLGGFVKITGMNPEEEIPPEVEDRAYYRQPVWKRIVVIAAGPFVNIVLALVIFFVLAAGFGLDGDATNTVGNVSDELPAAAGPRERRQPRRRRRSRRQRPAGRGADRPGQQPDRQARVRRRAASTAARRPSRWR